MVVRHSRDVEEYRQRLLDWSSQGGDEEDEDSPQALLRRARTTIVAAKYAYAQGHEKWLGLFGRAIGQIEACPEHHQDVLLASLCALHRSEAVAK